jgi:hypothetical protein
LGKISQIGYEKRWHEKQKKCFAPSFIGRYS